jgi:antitoxin component YwqK of YwqJK toxin-antitoxin module
VRWYENGQLSKKSSYKNGKKEGLFEAWWGNGKLAFKVNYIDEKKEGLFLHWDNQGNLSFPSCFKAGERADLSYCDI